MSEICKIKFPMTPPQSGREHGGDFFAGLGGSGGEHSPLTQIGLRKPLTQHDRQAVGVHPSWDPARPPGSGGTGEFGIDTPPSLVTGRSISGGQIFTLVTGRKFQRICQICKGGTLCKNHFRIVTEPNSGDENFRIVTGSKLAEMLPLKGGIYSKYPGNHILQRNKHQ